MIVVAACAGMTGEGGALTFYLGVIPANYLGVILANYPGVIPANYLGVIPAEAGIQCLSGATTSGRRLDPGLRRDDGRRSPRCALVHVGVIPAKAGIQ